MKPPKPNTVALGDAVNVMNSMAPKSVDLIFADPPYNLQLKNTLRRPNNSVVNGVPDQWDKFPSFQEYDQFTALWLRAAKRILKPNATLWTIGSYHNVYRVGYILQNLGFWILNDVVWIKSNPTPNFRGTRLTNAHETLIRAAVSQNASPNFNYHALKQLNDNKQMRSDWLLPVCPRSERLLNPDGSSLHPTQKPEALLKRIILSSTKPNDLVFDPFFGSGTTGAAAVSLQRRFIGVDKYPKYVNAARRRIKNTQPLPIKSLSLTPSPRDLPRVPFGAVVEHGLLKPGSPLFDPQGKPRAHVHIDGSLVCNNVRGSIHQIAALASGTPSCNGWTFWQYQSAPNRLESINLLREHARSAFSNRVADGVAPAKTRSPRSSPRSNSRA